MTVSRDATEQNRGIGRAFYEGGGRDEFGSFACRLADDFRVFVPDYLPWGGTSGK